MPGSSSISSSSSSKRGQGNNGAGPLSQGPAGRASSIMAGMNGAMGTGGSILENVGAVKQKPRPSGLQGSLMQHQSPAASAGSPHNAAGLQNGACVADPAACHDQSAAPSAVGAVQADEDADISSKRIQWENELYEELERHRKEQRVARQANQAARLSAMQH